MDALLRTSVTASESTSPSSHQPDSRGDDRVLDMVDVKRAPSR